MKTMEFLVNHPILCLVGVLALLIAVDAGAENSRKNHIQERILRVQMSDGSICYVLGNSVSCVRQ